MLTLVSDRAKTNRSAQLEELSWSLTKNRTGVKVRSKERPDNIMTTDYFTPLKKNVNPSTSHSLSEPAVAKLKLVTFV